MKSTIDKLDGLKRKLNITVSNEEVTKEFNKAYSSVRSEASIKGFRKGKAPLDKIKAEYGDRVKKDVIDRLINNSYFDALDEHSATPVTQPSINFSSFDENKDFSFTAEFEIRPEISLESYEGVKLTKGSTEVSDKEIQDSLENIQKNHLKQETIFDDRPAQEHDIAVIDFDGYIENEPLQGGKAEGHPLKLGSQSFIEGFEEGIMGMKIGDSKTINLKFPENYQSKEIAGKPVRFEVKLKELKKEVLPELNDEFAKSLGSFDNLDKLKETVKKELTQSKENDVNEKLKKDLMDALIEKNPFDAPMTLVEEQKKNLIQDTEQKLSQQGLTPEQMDEYRKKWDKDYSDTALFMVKSSFLIDELAKKLEIKVDKEAFESKFSEMSASTGLPLETVKEFYNNGERKNQIFYQILEEKVIRSVLDLSEIKEA